MPTRRRPAHGVLWPDDRPPIVFLTVCTKDRRRWLADERAHADLVDAWRAADRWLVGRYVLMPDHVHLFCAPVDGPATLEAWVRYWKSCFTRSGADRSRRWQSGHWDTRLRREENYDAKWSYVRENPVRAQLAPTADAWPYQGELNDLRWG
ncbi:MAG: hypothetical protein AAF805_07875 [Planctomycetota bacterium]